MSTVIDRIHQSINATLKSVNGILESNKAMEWREPLSIVLDSVSKMVNDCPNTQLIGKVQATRDKFNKTYNLDCFYGYKLSDKYINIPSMFDDKADHHQFISILQCIDCQSKLTEKIPFDINKVIAEYSTGKIKSCYNTQCDNEIFTMKGSVTPEEPAFIHCNKTNRYFCHQHIEQTDICDFCDAIQWIPDCIKCDASECDDEYSCQYDKCEYFVDKNLNCNGCNKIICLRWEHENDANIHHCNQCKQRICQQCRAWCDFCEEIVCKECEIKYGLNCISEKCDVSIINHPSCNKYCQCQLDQRELCMDCVKHSCLDYGKIRCITTVPNICDGTNCKICQSMQ